MLSQKILRRKLRTYLEVILLFVVPIALLYFNIIPREFYLGVLVIYSCFVLVLVIREHWSLKTLDIRLDNLKKSILPYIVFTLLGIAALIILASILGKTKVSPNLYLLFLGWSIPIAFVQEFLYRGFLMHELYRLYASIGAVIVANAVLFAFLHVIYSGGAVILPLTFFGGLGFAWMYHKYPNLILISISHGILNFIAILYSFF